MDSFVKLAQPAAHASAPWTSTMKQDDTYLSDLRKLRHSLVAHSWFSQLFHMLGNVRWANVSLGSNMTERLVFLH